MADVPGFALVPDRWLYVTMQGLGSTAEVSEAGAIVDVWLKVPESADGFRPHVSVVYFSADGAARPAADSLVRVTTYPAIARIAAAGSVESPLLYVRGDREGGDIQTYAQGFRNAGVGDLTTAVGAEAGRFAQKEQAADVWALMRLHRRDGGMSGCA
ncbi:hypothetical protein ABZX88_33575 [Kitasatospora aureofaciens]|uniref:hypothetical protein n=1 Tax=Kitasatospora aureofaciens TaxID=1894 RepID=UPI0033A820CE